MPPAHIALLVSRQEEEIREQLRSYSGANRTYQWWWLLRKISECRTEACTLWRKVTWKSGEKRKKKDHEKPSSLMIFTPVSSCANQIASISIETFCHTSRNKVTKTQSSCKSIEWQARWVVSGMDKRTYRTYIHTHETPGWTKKISHWLTRSESIQQFKRIQKKSKQAWMGRFRLLAALSWFLPQILPVEGQSQQKIYFVVLTEPSKHRLDRVEVTSIIPPH